MKIAASCIAVVGFLVTNWGAFSTYRGRMKQDPVDSGLYTVPNDGPGTLVLTVVGALLALAGSVVAILS